MGADEKEPTPTEEFRRGLGMMWSAARRAARSVPPVDAEKLADNGRRVVESASSRVGERFKEAKVEERALTASREVTAAFERVASRVDAAIARAIEGSEGRASTVADDAPAGGAEDDAARRVRIDDDDR